MPINMDIATSNNDVRAVLSFLATTHNNRMDFSCNITPQAIARAYTKFGRHSERVRQFADEVANFVADMEKYAQENPEEVNLCILAAAALEEERS